MKKYVDRDKLQEYTDKLTAKYKRMFGNPLIANTVAEMIDTNKIYVYLGSETGYTSGNWYYYDGSTWVSGGVYNAVAVDTDKTLSVVDKAADGKAVGDAIRSVQSGLTTEIARAEAEEARIEALFTQPVEEAVNNWLDEHPEATTTVEDESLTYEKLVPGTLGFVTPEMFGAKGDGITDDTMAIQSAVDSGFAVYFDKEYIIYGTISITSPCAIVGNPSGYIRQTKVNTNAIEISGSEPIVVKSLHIIGVGSDYEPQSGGKYRPYGIKITGTSNNHIKSVCVKNCVVEKCSWADISVVYADNVIVTENTVIGTGVDGGVTTDDNYQFGIIVSDCNNIRISNNDVSHTAQGIYLGENVNNVAIEENIIHDIEGQHGIYSVYADGYVLTNNIFRNIAYAGCKIQHSNDTIKDSTNIVVSGNVFDTIGQQGFMLIDISSGQTYYFMDVAITSNVFYNCYTGVLVAGSKDVNISDNVYIGGVNKVSGISIGYRNDRLLIQDNKITNSDNGIYARSDSAIGDIIIKGNVLKSAGISLSGASSLGAVTYINNTADSISGLPSKVIVGKNKGNNIYSMPDSELSLEFSAGDMALFSNSASAGYVGAKMDSNKAWMYFGKYDFTKYLFQASVQEYWQINNIYAYSTDEHTLYIVYDIKCLGRGTRRDLGRLKGIPSTMLPSSTITIGTGAGGAYINLTSLGYITAEAGTVGTIYSGTVKLVDGVITT